MQWLDLANGGFEAGGAVAAWMNVRRLRRDRQIKGTDWRTVVFYTSWGLFNMLLYPSYHLWWSTVAGAVLCVGNLAWVLAALTVKNKS